MVENPKLVSISNDNNTIPQATKPFASQWDGDQDCANVRYTEYMCMVQVRDTSGCGQLVGGINMPLPKTVITTLLTEHPSATEDR